MHLVDKLEKRRLILGSKSPRRQQFIKDLGLSFEVREKQIDEEYPNTLREKEIPKYLSQLKAKAFLDELQPEELLITGDTIVWFNGKVLHKPKDKAEAIALLRQLSGQKHKVISSACLTSTEKSIVVTGVTNVFFHNFSPSEIQFYIDQFKPFDKAGGYGIQEWIGQIGIKKIDGSFYTVMGMPIDKVYHALMNF